MRSVLKTPQPESSPTCPGARQRSVDFLNLVVMQNELVQHASFYRVRSPKLMPPANSETG